MDNIHAVVLMQNSQKFIKRVFANIILNQKHCLPITVIDCHVIQKCGLSILNNYLYFIVAMATMFVIIQFSDKVCCL